jgi:exodeoxyribonuclease (lambda-induced)
MSGFIYIPCEQGSADWHQHRAGVITASMFGEILEIPARGKERYNAKARRYATNKAIERISGKPLNDEMEGFTSWAMKRGNEKEPLARIEYVARTGSIVDPAGICLSMDKRFGASSDGFVGDKGSCEIKCLVASEKLFQTWVDGSHEEYLPQIQGCLWLSGREWCDFCMYAPQLSAIGKTLYIQRIPRDDDYIEKMELELLAFNALVEEHVHALRSAA